MEKLQVFICENLYPEFQCALQREGLEDFEIRVFPFLCDHKGRKTEYSALFDMLGKISTYASRRDLIGIIKEHFLMIFGAQNFIFWSDRIDSFPEELREFLKNEERYILFREENRFCIKIAWHGILYGVIDVSGFSFPQYMEKYLNLAVEVSKFVGLVFHNNEQYEKALESEEELKLSQHDSMTGLYNRTYINRILADDAADNITSVFIFGIDKLKYVNENYGHAEGDKLLNGFTEIMKQCFRETDIVARIGGDEFAAFLYDVDDEIAKLIKQRIIDLIKANNDNQKSKRLELSVSIGYAKLEEENDTIEVLMNRAYKQMYANKALKRTSI